MLTEEEICLKEVLKHVNLHNSLFICETIFGGSVNFNRRRAIGDTIARMSMVIPKYEQELQSLERKQKKETLVAIGFY